LIRRNFLSLNLKVLNRCTGIDQWYRRYVIKFANRPVPMPVPRY